MSESLAKKNQKTALIAFSIVIGMIGMAFASVPLYDMFCRVTGFGGTTQVSESAPEENAVLDRMVKVNFMTSTHRDMPWHFGAERRSVRLNIGRDALINFKARNPTDTPIVGTAIYNVTPLKAGKYFYKTQCFCFDRQVLNPGQSVNMPVVFYIDPAMDEDPNMQDVEVITLSYTFFQSDSQALETAMENLEN